MNTMTDDEIIAMLRTRSSPALRMIGGEVTGYVQARQEVTMRFEATAQMCHSQVIVQGGFITAMVDSAMAHAAMGCYAERVAVPTLEIKVNFLEAGNPGPMLATARVVRLGRTVGFLEADLHQRERRIATATSTIRIIAPKQ